MGAGVISGFVSDGIVSCIEYSCCMWVLESQLVRLEAIKRLVVRPSKLILQWFKERLPASRTRDTVGVVLRDPFQWLPTS